MRTREKKTLAWTSGVVIILILGVYGIFFLRADHKMDMHSEREDFIETKDKIISTLIVQGDYACCLEKPCIYCIEKTPGHGEGATCKCLDDVMNGRHPCGECIGEIMEGHGNPYIAKYFARAIAEEVGEEHLNTLKEIVSDKYEVPVGEQI